MGESPWEKSKTTFAIFLKFPQSLDKPKTENAKNRSCQKQKMPKIENTKNRKY